VIDPAQIPERPAKPDMNKVLLVTLVVGLGLGGGLAYMAEMLDTSYKSPDEVEKELELPILVSMPIRYTEKEIRRMKMRRIFGYVFVSVGFVAVAVAIVIATKGVDKTMEFVNQIIGKIYAF
jgi:nitrogen fixation/metabolism regulation signal transduction histidine kinase